MGLQLNLLTIDGAAHVAKLPHATGVEIMEELNGDGQLSFNVARSTADAAALLAAAEGLLQVSLDGYPIGYAVLDRDGDDPTDDKGAARPVTFTAPGTPVLLSDAIVRGATDTELQRLFDGVTPGFIMRTLLLEAQGRGALAGITWTFTDTHDSNGVAWPTPYSKQYETGVTVRSVLADLVDFRMVDFRMVGLQLNMYVADTELDQDQPDVVLQASWFTEAPRDRGRQGKVTHLYTLGEGGITYTATSATPGRRRESFAQVGGIADAGTLQLAADATLAPLAKVQEGVTVTYLLDPAGQRPTPWGDYLVGDSIRRGDQRLPTGELEPLRVRSMSVSLDAEGATAVTLELNDLFLEADVRNKLLLDRLTNGSGVVGTGVPAYGVDTIKPHAPTGVVVTSDTYDTGNGDLLAQATMSWPPVVTNYDNTPTTDVVGYEVQHNVNAEGFGTAIYRTAAAVMSRDGFPLGGTLQVRVRAVDRAGNYSAWQVSAVTPLAVDTVAPPKLSNPVATGLLGLIVVAVNGLAFDGSPMPRDLANLEVWQSDDAGFNIGDPGSQLVQQLPPRGGEVVVRGTDYLVPVYFRTRARDKSGNLSVQSNETTAMRQMVGDGDVLEITGAVIADASIGSAKIIDLEATKISAGSIVVQIGFVDGELIAGDPDAARVQLGGYGLEAYNEDGVGSFAVDALTGTARVGPATGTRMELLVDSNVFQADDTWPMLRLWSNGPGWDGPGQLWATFTDTTVDYATTRLSSPYYSDWTKAAVLNLTGRADGTSQAYLDADEVNFTADTFTLGSSAGSVDFNLFASNEYAVQQAVGNKQGVAYSLGTAGVARVVARNNVGRIILQLEGAGIVLSPFAGVVSVGGGGMDMTSRLQMLGASINIDGANQTLSIGDPPTGGSANVNWNLTNGNLRLVTSTRRHKADEQPLELDPEQALRLQPTTYVRLDREDGDPAREVGFIAEDAADLGLHPWVMLDAEGEPYSFDYFRWVVALQAIARHHAAQVSALTERVAILETSA